MKQRIGEKRIIHMYCTSGSVDRVVNVMLTISYHSEYTVYLIHTVYME